MRILFLILLIILFFLLLSLIMYNNIRFRQFYHSNSSEGDSITFQSVGNFYKARLNNEDLEFPTLIQDRKSSISGGIVLLTKNTSSQDEFYEVKILNNGKEISKSIQRTRPGPSYMRMTFKADPKDDRKLSLQFRKYDTKTQKTLNGVPSVRLFSAWCYYY